MARAWLRPTRRAIDWIPLTLITAALAGTATILAWITIGVPTVIHYVAVAALAAGAVLGLGDPARPLLQALPTPPIVRLAHRAAFLILATAFAATAIVTGERVLGLSPTAEPELAAALVALTTLGTAVYAVTSPIIDRANETAAASILLWVAATAVPGNVLPDEVSLVWLHHPWLVTATAAAVALRATTHRCT